MPVGDYYRLIARVTPQHESFTGPTFDVPSYPETMKTLESYDGFSLTLSFGGIPAHSYLIYTRHHGFPSPLLDWTRSAYVAAFFAFATENRGVKKRSIYVWSPGQFIVGGTDTPELQRLGHYVPTHRRHVLQQCDYTVCATFGTTEMKWRFTPQDEVLASAEGNPPEHLWKFNIPSTERLKVLKYLDNFNLNAYSLFGSEESLMETMAIRELDLRASKKSGS